MNTKVILDIQNLPETLNGDYIVVSNIKDEGLWYYGCFKDKNRAQQVAEDCTNGFVVEIAKELAFTNDYKSESERLQQEIEKLSEKCKQAESGRRAFQDENFELRQQIIGLEDEVRSLVRTFRTIIAR